MEDAAINPAPLSGHLIYVTGKDGSMDCDVEKISLKYKIVTHLSSYCFVRTNPGQFQSKDVVENYLAIVSSSAFIFVLSKSSISDPHCLNQLGMALSYNIPTITVRDHEFELPKPLPSRFYQTEIVDKTGFIKSEQRVLTNLENLPAITTLANALVKSFENALVFDAQNQSEFSEQLLRLLLIHCRESKLLKAMSSSNSDASSSGEDAITEKSTQEKYGTSTAFMNSPYREKFPSYKEKIAFQREGKSVYCETKQVQKERHIYVRKKPKSRSMTKTKSATGSRSACSPSVSKGQALNFNISVIPPSPAPQSPLSFRKAHYTRPFKIVRGVNIGSAKLSLTYGADISNQHKQKPRSKSGTRLKTDSKERELSAQKNDEEQDGDKNNRGRSRTLEDTQGENEVKSTEEGKTKRRSPRHSLRRYSSLPVIPTQYLVTSKDSRKTPIVYHYPPGSTTPMRLSITSPHCSGTEEEEFEGIHISRTCTPVIDIETDAGYVTPNSPTHDDSK